MKMRFCLVPQQRAAACRRMNSLLAVAKPNQGFSEDDCAQGLPWLFFLRWRFSSCKARWEGFP